MAKLRYYTCSTDLLDKEVEMNRQRPLSKINLNYKRNLKQDNTEALDELARNFDFQKDKDELWNPEELSFLWGTPLWDQASKAERIKLNQLYWVAYYAQIISAEIATIYFNQTSAAALYTIEEFATTCRMLDHESFQERAHISAFRTIASQTEKELLGKQIFTYPMKLPYSETMIYQNTDLFRKAMKSWLLKAFSLLSSSSVFIGCQYFTVRGLRTLNGKLVQHKLSQYYQNHEDKENAPTPSKISYHHFLDESYHFNSSTIISQELYRLVPKPSAFERLVINQGVAGCQRDHFYFNGTVNGIFWYEPAIFPDVYKVFRSPMFDMQHDEALDMMAKCYLRENAAMTAANDMHKEAADSYAQYVQNLEFLSAKTASMGLMKSSSLADHINRNRACFAKFSSRVGAAV